MIEIILVTLVIIFIIIYRKSNGANVYKYINDNTGEKIEKYNKYSFRNVRKKAKELGQEYTLRQYITQIIIFAFLAFVISYVYFYNFVYVIIYVSIAIAFIPYLAYLRCKKAYSEFIFEQIQVYTTNVIMEFNTTQSFVKSLEGVRDSGVLEDPVLSDVSAMIDMSYKNGTIDESIEFFNSKYDFHIVKNMHQLFLQITNEGSQDSTEALENMSLDIDALVENVYRDRLDRQEFHKRFITFGFALYFLVMLVQILLGKDSYVELIENWILIATLNLLIIINTSFLISGEKYYNEDVGGE